MNKDYKSDYDEWLVHEKAWESLGDKLSVSLEIAFNQADQASLAIRNSGLDGISKVYPSFTASDISRLEDEREKLALFCKKIHRDGEDMLDDVFHYGVMKTLTDIYAFNPSDMTLSKGGTEYQLQSMMEIVTIDPALRADFAKKAKQLNTDKLSKDLKADLLDAISRYYDGDVTSYMTKTAGYSDSKRFNEDMSLVIEYYEYLNPKDAKVMNKFLSGLAKDGDKKYLEDIKNIKFIAYTAREPYKSVFFKYLKNLKIADYDYHELDSNGIRKSQYYSSTNKSIYVRFYGSNGEGKDDPRGPYVTFFHEIGHGVDDLLLKDKNYLFNNDKINFFSVDGNGVTIFEAAENDVRDNIRKSVDTYIELNRYNLSEANREKVVQGLMTYNFGGFTINSNLDKIYNGIIIQYKNTFSMNKTSATIYNGISDVYGGFTDNKLSGSFQHSNQIDKYGNTYWNDMYSNNQYRGSQGKELWAHAFARYMTSSEDAIEELENYFPSSMEIMKNVLE